MLGNMMFLYVMFLYVVLGKQVFCERTRHTSDPARCMTFAARAGDTRADRLHAFENVSMFVRPGRVKRSSVDLDMTGQGDQDTLNNFTNELFLCFCSPCAGFASS